MLTRSSTMRERRSHSGSGTSMRPGRSGCRQVNKRVLNVAGWAFVEGALAESYDGLEANDDD